MNRYSYVIDNPRNYIDPDGRVIIMSDGAWSQLQALGNFVVDHGGVSVSADVGNGALGVSSSFEFLPEFGNVELSGGWGVGSGVAGTANLTFGSAPDADIIVSVSGGRGWGGHADLATSHHGRSELTIGGGVGYSAGGSVTTPLLSGNLFFPTRQQATVTTCDEFTGCTSTVTWYEDSSLLFGAAQYLYGGLTSLMDGFFSGGFCIEGICAVPY